MKWAGCNYYPNWGTNEYEPEGTATSMHDCEGCDKLSYCTLTKDTPTWEWNEKIDKDLKEKWNELFKNVKYKVMMAFYGEETMLDKLFDSRTEAELYAISEECDYYQVFPVVEPKDGGCWFCHTKTSKMVFDTEFDTNVHLICLKKELKDHPDNPEAQIMKYLLEGEPN